MPSHSNVINHVRVGFHKAGRIEHGRVGQWIFRYLEKHQLAGEMQILDAPYLGHDQKEAGCSKDAMSGSVLTQFRRSRIYDLLAAFPLMLWCGFCLSAQLPLIMRHLTELLSGAIAPIDLLQFAALMGSAAFNLAAIHFLIGRTKPTAKSRGFLPRATAFASAFLGVSIYFLPTSHLTLAMQIVSNLLIFGGYGGALFVLFRLGRAFAIMPEARELRMRGPYAFVRHPLYVCETIAYSGMVLQFREPWAFLIMAASSVFMFARTIFEERVLEDEYSEYASYCARTARFIPGLF